MQKIKEISIANSKKKRVGLTIQKKNVLPMQIIKKTCIANVKKRIELPTQVIKKTCIATHCAHLGGKRLLRWEWDSNPHHF